MLKLIEPAFHDKYRTTIDSFLGLLKQYQNISLPSELLNQATFFIDKLSPSEQKPEGEIYGGAVFYPQQISPALNFSAYDSAEDMLGKVLSACQPHGQTYWTACVGIFRDQELSVPLIEKFERRHHFYQRLYEAFLKFGKANNVKLLAFTLRTCDPIDINTYKYWPALIEVKHPGSFDGCFYGLLPLKKGPHSFRKKEDTSIVFQPFAAIRQPSHHSSTQGRR